MSFLDGEALVALDEVQVEDAAPVVFEPIEKPKFCVCTTKPRQTFTTQEMCYQRMLKDLGNPDELLAGGVFWEKGLESIMELAITRVKADVILVVDYDSVYTPEDARKVIDALCESTDLAAVWATQVARHLDTPICHRSENDYGGTLTRQMFGHFGLTAIRAEAIAKLSHPWFWGHPDLDTGRWDDNAVDPDIFFWRKLRQAGMMAAQHNEAIIGHMELCVKWPVKGGIAYQPVQHYVAHGKPNDTAIDEAMFRRVSEGDKNGTRV